jgi:ER-bound oxygenase mpaB/B'/Rubber oxygenase, catalytic domain
MQSYRRRAGLFRSGKVRAEIAALDAERDCQRIASLLASYEFTWDIPRSLELALLHTYASDSVAGLLDQTGEFRRRGMKRYDDTRLLITQFVESGWDGVLGKRAILRINKLHGNYRIPNDDFLFVLWTFIAMPIYWCEKYAYRPMTTHEAHAWFAFWRGVGERMGIRDIPVERASYDAWVEAYERKHLVPNDAGRKIADSTLAVYTELLPGALRRAVLPAAQALLSPRAREAFSFASPSVFARVAVRVALGVNALITRWLPLTAYPTAIQSRTFDSKTYGKARPPPESLGADHG